MKITVTEKHIKNGDRMNRGSCPIALALRDKRRFKTISVGSESFFVQKKNKLGDFYLLPDEAQDFICTFDHGAPVQPLTFIVKKQS